MCFRSKEILFVIFTLFMESEKVFGNKYCAFELDGEAKYYMCPRNEYCCNFGCCVNLAFQFYQLWYYWLLIIIMFMICSGGGWWYRFCRQNDATSSYPTQNFNNTNNTLNSRELHARNMTEMTRRGRLTPSAHRLHRLTSNNNNNNNNNNNSHSNTNCINNTSNNNQQLYIQQLWKGPSNHQNLPPSYYSSNHYAVQDTQFYPECPYHQLYGPPPSYDSIIQIADPTASTGQTSCSLVATGNSTTPDEVVDETTQTNEIESQPEEINSLHDEATSPVISERSTDSETYHNESIKLLNKHSSSTSSIVIKNDIIINQTPKSLSTPIFNVIPSTSKIKVDDNTKISSV